MRSTGLLLITVGFLAGAFFAVQTPDNVIPWATFGPSVVVCAVGVALARLAIRKEKSDAGNLETGVAELRSSIAAIVENIRTLEAEKESLHPYELHGRIDELFQADLNRFVAARESIGHAYSLAAYAEMMNTFAAGERYLNRVWSASVDCYIDDCHEYLTRSREQFESTRSTLEALVGGPGRG